MKEYDEKINKVKDLLNKRKSNRTEKDSMRNLKWLVCNISKLCAYAEKKLYISCKVLQSTIDRMIGDNTIILDSTLPINIKIMRGRVVNPEFVDSVEHLSYNKNPKATQARLNPVGQPLFYGTIHFKENCGTHIIFSELEVKKNKSVCLLNSLTHKELTYRHLGIFAEVFTNKKPWYMDDDTWKYYNEIVDIYPRYATESDYMAFLLVENFLYDFMTRKSSQEVYNITNAIANILLSGNFDKNIEGLIYNSIHDNSTPNIVLQPSSVDEKLIFSDAEAIMVRKKYPYNLYLATTTHKGKILTNGKIEWQSTEK